MSEPSVSGPSQGSSMDENLLGSRFFENDEQIWPYTTVALAIVIFTLWALRSGLDIAAIVVIIIFYAVTCVISTRFALHHLFFDSNSKKFIFIRSGASWKMLFQALLGAAIPLLLPWFVLTSAVSNSDVFSNMLMILGMIIYIGIVPLIPSLASLSSVSILKTRVEADFDESNSTLSNVRIAVNPLDGIWYSLRDSPELSSQIENLILEFIQSQIQN